MIDPRRLAPSADTRLLMPPPRLARLPVFYTPQMVAAGDSFSPSADKPRDVLASWQALNLPLDVRSPEAVLVADLERAHHPPFVAAVLACRSDNGRSDNGRSDNGRRR